QASGSSRSGDVRSPPASPVFTVPRRSTSTADVSTAARGRCSTPRGTTNRSCGPSTTDRSAPSSRRSIVSSPASTRNSSSVSGCVCQTNSPSTLTTLTSSSLGLATRCGYQCPSKASRAVRRLRTSLMRPPCHGGRAREPAPALDLLARSSWLDRGAGRCDAGAMTSTGAARPGAAFGPDVYAARRERAAAHARAAGLAGLLVSPGPDLAYFTGYAPPETERLTLLAIPADGPGPTVVVPLLERGDLAAAPGADGLDVVTWRDGDDEHDAAARLLRADGSYAVSDATWALHVLGLQRALPGARFTAFTDAVPTLRAVKDAQEVERLAA